MLYSHIPRNYVRTSSWYITAQVSDDQEQWHEARVDNIGAGGMFFRSDLTLNEGDVAWLDLLIDPMFPEIPDKLHMKMTGRVSRAISLPGGVYANGVVFEVIEPADQIRLDELIRLSVARYGSDELER